MKQSVEEALISLGNFGTLQLITTAVFSLYQFIACVVAFSVSITLKVRQIPRKKIWSFSEMVDQFMLNRIKIG